MLDVRMMVQIAMVDRLHMEEAAGFDLGSRCIVTNWIEAVPTMETHIREMYWDVSGVIQLQNKR
tara:strand:+ start:4003 stop:4194 length:192 start_codon:yes stop_codon:yes gene_type:complete